jgi:hypothetical protein
MTAAFASISIIFEQPPVVELDVPDCRQQNRQRQ